MRTLAFAALAFVACLLLGRWQWHRYEVKDAVANRITTHYSAAPVPLSHVLATPDAPLPTPAEWTPVSATGRYDAASTLLVRNRPYQGTYGYEVIVPLDVRGGGVLLVDRGWVQNANTASQLPHVPPAPSGTVTVTGWLRQGEPDLGRQELPGQLASINLQQAQAQTGGDVYEAYIILKGEQAANAQHIVRPTPLEAPSTDKGPHLAYALQWWAGSVVGFILVFVGVRRETLDARWAAEHPDEATEPGTPDAPAPVGRPKKVRIWDEEDA